MISNTRRDELKRTVRLGVAPPLFAKGAADEVNDRDQG